jgi:hypothetical protein
MHKRRTNLSLLVSREDNALDFIVEGRKRRRLLIDAPYETNQSQINSFPCHRYGRGIDVLTVLSSDKLFASPR